MKKWALVIILAVALGAGSVYLFIPRVLTVSLSRTVRCNTEAAGRSMIDSLNWVKWNREVAGDGYVYRLNGRYYHQAGVLVRAGDDLVSSRIQLFPRAGRDSVILFWKCDRITSTNPVRRVLQYRQALRLREQMGRMLERIGSFLEDKRNVYGMDIRDSMSRDSALVVTQFRAAAYPDTKEIYRRIGEIRSYIIREGAKAVNYPMLNVSRARGGQYEVMIAVPVDRELKGDGVLFPRRFVPWKILSGEVHGGVYTAERAMDQLEQYVMDYQRTGMAIPYQALVTERDQEPDTARWVTRVVLPVF